MFTTICLVAIKLLKKILFIDLRIRLEKSSRSSVSDFLQEIELYRNYCDFINIHQLTVFDDEINYICQTTYA